MATAGDIVVNLTANSQQFNAGLKSAQGALSGFNSVIKVAGAAIAGFLSFQTIKGGLNFLHDTLEKIDAVGDAAEKLGVPVEFLSQLQHAAKMTDVPLESVSIGLKTMEKTLGEAGFKGSVVDAFMDIADVVAGTKGQFEQAAIASKVFKKAGIDLLPLLRQGSDGITEWGDEAEKFGNLITQDVKNTVDEADAAFKRMDASMEGLKNTIAVSLAPIFTDNLAPAILDVTQKTREWITSTEGIETMTDAWNTFAESIGSIADNFSVAQTALVNFGKAMGGLADFSGQQGMEKIFGAAFGVAVPGFGGKGMANDWNAIFDNIDFDEPKVFGDKIKNAMKDLINPRIGGPPPGAPGPPEPFKFPEPKEIHLKGPTTFKTGETDVFSKEGFSAFARAVNGPNQNIPQKQLEEQKKANGKLGDIVTAIKAIPEPAGPGEDF